uniref:Uncharacterized protein n=1 Tax=Arundo donax TaxID=35708 RepID=A0A0A9F1U9_ARUDO
MACCIIACRCFSRFCPGMYFQFRNHPHF